MVEGPVTVTKKNGETTVVDCFGVGQSFDVDGTPYRYGYREPKAEEPKTKPAVVPASSGHEGNFVPDDLEAGDDDYVVDDDGRSVPYDF